MKILLVGQIKSAMTYHRLIVPFAKLADDRSLDISRVESLECLEVDDLLKTFDAVVVNRVFSASVQSHDNLWTKIERNGVKVYVDIDDHWILPHSHQLFYMYKQNRYTDIIVDMIKRSTGVIVTHERLAGHVRKINKNVAICPNAINTDDRVWQKSPCEEMSVGWVGGSMHLKDLEMLDSFGKSMVRHPARVVLGGYSDTPVWHRFEHILTGGSLKKNYMRIAQAEVTQYAKMYDHMTVALAPLYNNEFNKCKSELKALEAGAKGLAFVCSDIHPYTLICNKGNSILCNDARDWYRAVQRLEDRSFAEDLAQNLHNDCKEFRNLSDINNTRYEFIFN